jgi:hypothetical protein
VKEPTALFVCGAIYTCLAGLGLILLAF